VRCAGARIALRRGRGAAARPALAPTRARHPTNPSGGVRTGAPPPPAPGGGGDVVLDSFKEQQAQIRALMDGLKVGRVGVQGRAAGAGSARARRRRADPSTSPPQSIPVPLSGDPAAVKKFAADVDALKRRVGVPDDADLEGALAAHAIKAARGDVRKVLSSMGPDLDDAVAADIAAAVDAAERESGGALSDGNGKGWSIFSAKLATLAKARGLDDVAKVKADAALATHAATIKSLADGAADAMAAAARRDGLEGTPDPATLKPKW